MNVEIVGPNLHPSVEWSGYDFHVHAAGCTDLRRYEGMRDQRGDFLWVVDAANDEEIVSEIYADFLPTGDDGELNSWVDFADTVRIFPCVYKEES
jgi:hypothetical protein